MVNIEPSFEVWLNGRHVHFGDASISIFTNSFHYGTSAFEGIRCYPSGIGGSIFRLDDHVHRLFYSASSLGISIGFSFDEIKQAIIDTVKKNDQYSLYIRPVAFIAEETLGLLPTNFHANNVILPWHWKGSKKSLSVTISSLSRINPTTTRIDAKISGHYVNSYLAKLEANKLGYEDAILCDAKGFIAEATTQNIFMVKKGVVFTPGPQAILPGITRNTVMTLLNDANIEMREVAITPETLMSADEIFLTGTAAEVQAVVNVDGKLIGDGKPGSLTRNLQGQYQSIVHGNDSKYLGWLTTV